MNKRCIRIVTLLMIGMGVVFFGKGIYIFGKARFAQFLLKKAWHQTVEEGRNVKPWSWADTHPIARMIVLRLNEEYIVLEGCSGNSLAFGPGHMTGTALPGEYGNCVISGHRDTSFEFLQDLKKGDRIEMENSNGETITYSVVDLLITTKDDTSVMKNTSASTMTLITCYPFDAITSGDQRYVVSLCKN